MFGCSDDHNSKCRRTNDRSARSAGTRSSRLRALDPAWVGSGRENVRAVLSSATGEPWFRPRLVPRPALSATAPSSPILLRARRSSTSARLWERPRASDAMACRLVHKARWFRLGGSGWVADGSSRRGTTTAQRQPPPILSVLHTAHAQAAAPPSALPESESSSREPSALRSSILPTAAMPSAPMPFRIAWMSRTAEWGLDEMQSPLTR